MHCKPSIAICVSPLTEKISACHQICGVHLRSSVCVCGIIASFSGQITARQIDFQTMSKEDLQLRESTKLYPPRFVFKIRGSSTAGEPKALFIFEGATEEIVKEIILPKQPGQQEYGMPQHDSSYQTCTQIQSTVQQQVLPDSHSRLQSVYPHSPTTTLTRQTTQLTGSQAYSELQSTPQTFTSPSQEGELPENLFQLQLRREIRASKSTKTLT